MGFRWNVQGLNSAKLGNAEVSCEALVIFFCIKIEYYKTFKISLFWNFLKEKCEKEQKWAEQLEKNQLFYILSSLNI